MALAAGTRIGDFVSHSGYIMARLDALRNGPAGWRLNISSLQKMSSETVPKGMGARQALQFSARGPLEAWQETATRAGSVTVGVL